MPANSGLKWLFLDPMSRIKKLKKRAQDLEEQLNYISGTWQQARLEGNPSWKKYYNEEVALIKKHINTLEQELQELDRAKKRRRIARILIYWGVWVSPEGEMWTICTTLDNKNVAQVVWVSSGEVRIMKSNEYLRLYGNYLEQIENGNY